MKKLILAAAITLLLPVNMATAAQYQPQERSSSQYGAERNPEEISKLSTLKSINRLGYSLQRLHDDGIHVDTTALENELAVVKRELQKGLPPAQSHSQFTRKPYQYQQRGD
jgi:hypothetical protein